MTITVVAVENVGQYLARCTSMDLCYAANNSGVSGTETDGSTVQSEVQGRKEFHVVIVSQVWYGEKMGKGMQKARKNVGKRKENFIKRRASKEITGILAGIKHTWEKRQERVLCKEKWHCFRTSRMQQTQTLSRTYRAPLNVSLFFEIPVTDVTSIYWEVQNTFPIVYILGMKLVLFRARCFHKLW